MVVLFASAWLFVEIGAVEWSFPLQQVAMVVMLIPGGMITAPEIERQLKRRLPRSRT